MTYRYSIITCITNDFEPCRKILDKQSDVEYILVSNRDNTKSGEWNLVVDHRFDNLSPFDLVFYVRWHPFEYVHSDVCVWVDGSMDVKTRGIDVLVNKLVENDNVDAAFNSHPSRNNIVDEYAVWCAHRNYDECNVYKCLSYMSHQNYDFDNKLLFQTGFSVRKNTSLINAVNSKIYSLCKKFGVNDCVDRLDQTLATYCIANDIPRNKYLTIPSTTEYVVPHKHGHV